MVHCQRYNECVFTTLLRNNPATSVKIYLEVDFNVPTHLAQSASEYLTFSSELDLLYVSMRPFVLGPDQRHKK